MARGSKQKKDYFDAFSRSDAFRVSEHNALLDALDNPVEGLSLSKYDELGLSKPNAIVI